MIGLPELAKQLGGDVRHNGSISCPGPGHSPKDRSLSVWLDHDGKLQVHSFAGDDWALCKDYVRERLGLPSWEPPIGKKGKRQPRLFRHSTNEHIVADIERRIARARLLWSESLDPRGTFAETYLHSRGLRLPKDPEVLLRTIRFHPACPFPDGGRDPALIAAFTPILPEVPDDPFLDPPPTAIHRIRGRGHKNKAMLAPVQGQAIMLSPWWHVRGSLHICEGLETALALYREGAQEGCCRPIWALGSASAIRSFPVLARVARLIIWADNDPTGTGLLAAQACGERWQKSGRDVLIHIRTTRGADYADGVVS